MAVAGDPRRESVISLLEQPPPRIRSFRRWVLEDDLPLTKSKLDRVLQLAKGKDVLDVGCVGGRNEPIESTTHALIAGVAQSCLGIDLVVDEIERRRLAGYDVEVASAEEFEVERRFDVIVAADLIEHLSNPGRFLAKARKHLRPSGFLCLVTPNALSLNNALKSLAGVKVTVNPEHTCWFDRRTLHQLLARYGFAVVEEYWQDYQRHPLSAMFLRFRKNLAAHIIIISTVRTGAIPQ